MKQGAWGWLLDEYGGKGGRKGNGGGKGEGERGEDVVVVAIVNIFFYGSSTS